MERLEPGYRTPLSRAKGLGSAKHGVAHFIIERSTSVALVPLCLWAVWGVLKVAPGGYEGAVAFLQSPINAAFTALLLVVGAWHTQLGMQVVIEDYIHRKRSKLPLLLLNSGVAGLAAVMGVIGVLKVAFSGGVH